MYLVIVCTRQSCAFICFWQTPANHMWKWSQGRSVSFRHQTSASHVFPLPPHYVWRFFKAFVEIGWLWIAMATGFDLLAAKDQGVRCRISFDFFFSLSASTTAYRTNGSQLLWQIPSGWRQSAWRALWLGRGLLRAAAPPVSPATVGPRLMMRVVWFTQPAVTWWFNNHSSILSNWLYSTMTD